MRPCLKIKNKRGPFSLSGRGLPSSHEALPEVHLYARERGWPKEAFSCEGAMVWDALALGSRPPAGRILGTLVGGLVMATLE